MLECDAASCPAHPYIYSAAVTTHRTGFPYTMTPLPLAFPHDPAVYELENTTRRGYQWLIGDALMAIPLYGDDYATAGARDVYLPRGRWIDYDTGEVVRRAENALGASDSGDAHAAARRRDRCRRRGAQGRLLARVYPVTSKASTIFHHHDGRDTSIRIDVGSWRTPTVVAANDVPVKATHDGVALTFAIEPGASYVVRSAAERP